MSGKERSESRQAEGLPSGRLSSLLAELAREPEAGAGWDGALQPGTVVGRFELLREIGRGGFGVVYEARDTALGRRVAFKGVRPGRRPDLGEYRLLLEADAAARLSHPNIVTLFDLGRSEHGPYLVLELLHGRTLARRLEEGPVPVREAVHIAAEVARGVAHAHANGVVHRDLKPGNVFLCDDGQVKVLDLGMAHAFGRPRAEGGTPGFMAPEQGRGAPEDERTDVFALGVILHRMLARELPFAPGSRWRLAAPILDVPGSPGLGDLGARMLERDPVKRPRNAGEVLAALAPILQEMDRAPAAALPLPRTRRPRLRLALGAASIAAAAALLALVGAWALSQARRPVRPPSIAVLPFADLSPEKDQEHFSDGIAEEVLNALGRVEGLRVPGRTSSFFFKGKDVRLADVGRELDVQAVLEGSVRKAGNRVRVTTQIVSTADGRRLWGRTYDRELTDVFALQDDIARSVVEALDVRLLQGNEPPFRSYATRDPEVYAQYLRGRQQYYRMAGDGLKRAVEAFETALARDPGYAPAWAGLGLPLFHLSSDGGTPGEVVARHRRALAAAERAVALSPDLPEALSTRGVLRSMVEHDMAGAQADFERAIALNGSDATSRRRYGIFLQDLGRLPEAIAQLRKAVEIDPLGNSWNALGHLYQAAGDLDQAEAAYRRQVRVSPDSPAPMYGLGRNQLLRGRPADALATFERNGEAYFRLWGRSAAEHALGHEGPSRAALEELVSGHASGGAFGIAELLAWRGEKDRALEWLRRSSEQREEDFTMSPFLRPLREDPRTAPSLRQMGLPVD